MQTDKEAYKSPRRSDSIFMFIKDLGLASPARSVESTQDLGQAESRPLARHFEEEARDSSVASGLDDSESRLVAVRAFRNDC